MNYKESSVKLNEFNDFMDGIRSKQKMNLIKNAILDIANCLTKIQVSNDKIKHKNFEPSVPTLKNDQQSVILPTGESIFNEKPYVNGRHATTVVIDECTQINAEHIEKLLNQIKPNQITNYEKSITCNLNRIFTRFMR